QMTVPVVVGKVVQKEMPVQLHAVGTVEAVSTVMIKPQAAGLLLSIHFKEGQEVKKGDLLFTIDKRPYEATLAQARANLAKDIAQAKTARELTARYENLVKKDYVTKEQFDQVRTSAEALEASADADRAEAENAQLQLNYCEIRSPIDGRTGNLMVHAGNVMKVNETEMVQIHQMDPVYVTFSVPEQNLSDIRTFNSRGTLQVVVTDKSGNNPVTGSLAFINNEVNADTGTIQLKGVFENKEKLLWPGEFTNATLRLTSRPKAIVVPAQAVESGQNGTYVYIVKPDQTAEVRPVTPGDTIGQETIIEKGVQPGETVVTDGQLRLLPGAKVEFQAPGSTS
ncbi:MAG TPA: efflux RND transporter periplasmic adaptor subunit, partial [Acidobacteriota bacterium]|nr:efflux RND transporter periplasmic adaptor subunit [Acidobacteriota bacterium]